MPIDHQHRLIFIHIPKTAGTSVEELLGLRGSWQVENLTSYFGLIQTERMKAFEFGSHFLQHLTLAELSRAIGSNLLGYTPFTVVRDPWTRLLSSFRRKDPDLCQCYRNQVGRDLNQLTLEEFIDVASWLNHPHLRPQTQFLFPQDLPGYHNEPDLRLHIFRQEKLSELEHWLSERLNQRLRLPHANVAVPESAIPKLTSVLLSKLQGRVKEIYAVDYAVLNYG